MYTQVVHRVVYTGYVHLPPAIPGYVHLPPAIPGYTTMVHLSHTWVYHHGTPVTHPGYTPPEVYPPPGYIRDMRRIELSFFGRIGEI